MNSISMISNSITSLRKFQKNLPNFITIKISMFLLQIINLKAKIYKKSIKTKFLQRMIFNS